MTTLRVPVEGTFAPLVGRSILAVEDEAFVAIWLAEMLDDLGAHILGPARSVRDAMRLPGADAADAAVLDLRLGDGDSLDVAGALAAKGCAIVFATGYCHDVLITRHRVWPVISKPYDRFDLAAALALALSHTDARHPARAPG